MLKGVVIAKGPQYCTASVAPEVVAVERQGFQRRAVKDEPLPNGGGTIAPSRILSEAALMGRDTSAPRSSARFSSGPLKSTWSRSTELPGSAATMMPSASASSEALLNSTAVTSGECSRLRASPA